MQNNTIGLFHLYQPLYVVEIPDNAKKPWFILSSSLSGIRAILRFDKASYWIRITDNRISDEVSPHLAKALMAFFNSKSDMGDLTYWQKLITCWNQRFPDNPVDPNLVMPDYTKLVYDKNQLQNAYDAARQYRNKCFKDFEDSLVKYDIVCINVQGGGQESYSSLSRFTEKGYSIVGAVQGADNSQPLVFLQRPAFDFDYGAIDDLIKDI